MVRYYFHDGKKYKEERKWEVVKRCDKPLVRADAAISTHPKDKETENKQLIK